MTAQSTSFLSRLKEVRGNETIENAAQFFESLMDAVTFSSKPLRPSEVERFQLIYEEIVKRKVVDSQKQDFEGHYLVYTVLKRTLAKLCPDNSRNYLEPVQNVHRIILKEILPNDAAKNFLEKCFLIFEETYNFALTIAKGIPKKEGMILEY